MRAADIILKKRGVGKIPGAALTKEEIDGAYEKNTGLLIYGE